jgi:hypothetical protein
MKLNGELFSELTEEIEAAIGTVLSDHDLEDDPQIAILALLSVASEQLPDWEKEDKREFGKAEIKIRQLQNWIRDADDLPWPKQPELPPEQVAQWSPPTDTALDQLSEKIRLLHNRERIGVAARELFDAVADPAHPEGELTGLYLLAQTLIWLFGVYYNEYGETQDVSRDVVIDFLKKHVFPFDSERA